MYTVRKIIGSLLDSILPSNMAVCLIFLFSLLFFFPAQSKLVSGTFHAYAHQPVTLSLFSGTSSLTLDSVITDGLGRFTLRYADSIQGMGFLSAPGYPMFLLVLDEDIELTGSELTRTDSIYVVKGKQNIILQQYIREFPVSEQALSAWQFLSQQYSLHNQFKGKKKQTRVIRAEISRIQTEEKNFYSSLSAQGYLGWFLPFRKRISALSQIAQYRPQEVQSTLLSLQRLDYSDDRLYYSGILKESIENHFWFIENTVNPIDSAFSQMKLVVDKLVMQLKPDDNRLNEVAGFLSAFLEKRSLFPVSEHLSAVLLGSEGCLLDTATSALLAATQKMKVGNKAPDIVFAEHTYFPDSQQVSKLSDLKARLYVVVFGSGWCGHCTREIPQLQNLYIDWKKKNVEIVFISLDTTPLAFAQFSASFPFISTCDYKKWDSEPVRSYNVFSTPSYFILSSDLTILNRPASIAQLKSWIVNN